MQIRELQCGESLAGIREEWNALVEGCSSATIYQSWDWNEAWWKHFGDRKQKRVLLVESGGRLVGIAPLYISYHLNTPLRRLAFAGTGVSDYLNTISLDGFERQVTNSVLKYLDSAGGFDLADLQQLQPGGALVDAACGRRNDTSIRRTPYVLQQEPCPYIPLPATWEDLGNQVGKKMRSNLVYYDRLLNRTYSNTHIGLAAPDELKNAMSALFDLHQRRWKARALPGVMGSARVRAFHLDVARRFQANGWLRLHVIYVDGEIVSALYCFHFRGRAYYYLGGFAPEMAKFSLGTVLTGRAVKTAIEEGCGEFDFLRGAEPYKHRWQPEVRTNNRILLADRRSIRSRALVTLIGFERYVEHRAKVFAENRGRGKK